MVKAINSCVHLTDAERNDIKRIAKTDDISVALQAAVEFFIENKE